MLIFASVKTKKDNENNVRKYILVVASVTTPAVVREQCSYVYMYNIDIKRALSHQATGLFRLNISHRLHGLYELS